MVLGFFKSASQRSAEALQSHINSLKGLDDRGLGALALYCSFFRLLELDFVSKNASPNENAEFVQLYYRPLMVKLPSIEVAISSMDQTLLKTEQNRRKLADNPLAQGVFGLLGAAQQTWRNTWFGCLHSEVRYLSREMWGLVSVGFPSVEATAWTLMNDPQFKVSPREIQFFETALRDHHDGPDYLKIPEGFEPFHR